MKIQVSTRKGEKGRKVHRALEELLEELKDNFGYRIHSFFQGEEDVPIVHFGKKSFNAIYDMREEYTKKHKGLIDKLMRVNEKLNVLRLGNPHHSDRVTLSLKEDTNKDLIKALKAQRKVYKLFSQTVDKYIEKSTDEEARIDKIIEEIRANCKYVKIEVFNPYTEGTHVYGDRDEYSISMRLDRFNEAFDDIDAAIELLSK